MANQGANLNIQVAFQSVQAATTAVNSLAAAANNAQSSTNRLTAAASQAANANNALAAASNAAQQSASRVAAANNQMATSTGNLTAIINQAISSITALSNAAQQGATRIQAAQTRTITGVNNMAASTKLATWHMQMFWFQVNDVATGLATGQSPFMILAQQGGQVYQALNGPGGVRAGLANVGSSIINLVTPARLLGGALVAAATVSIYAWSKFDDQQRNIRNAVEGLGREAGITAEQVRRAAEAGAGAGKLSISDAASFSANLLRNQPQISITNLQRAVELSKRFADLYTNGDIQKGQEKLNELIGGGAQGILEFGRKYVLFSDTQRQAIREAINANKPDPAITAFLDAIDSKTKGLTSATGPIADAWTRIKNAISDTVTTLGAFIDKFATLKALPDQTAGFFEGIARGARVATGQQPMSGTTRSILSMMGAGANAAVSGGLVAPPTPPLPPVRPSDLTGLRAATGAVGDLAKATLENSRAVDLSSAAEGTFAEKLRASSGAAGMVAKANADNADLLQRQQGTLSDLVERTSKSSAAWGVYRQALDQTNEAIRNGTDVEKAAAVASNQSIQKRADAAARERQDAEDVARAQIGQVDVLEKLRGKRQQLEAIPLADRTREDKEALNQLIHAEQTQLDVNGKRLDAEQLFDRAAGVRVRQITDITVAQRAQTAYEAKLNELIGQGVTPILAQKQAMEAYNLVLTESNQQMRLASREQEFTQQRLDLERSLLFATADARARANAELAKEQELRRAGRDPSGAIEQAQIKIAGNQAAQDVRDRNLDRQWDSIKTTGVEAFTSLATAIASGTKAMDAMIQVSKQLGSALISGGLKGVIEGLATQNYVQAGIGAAEAGVGAALSFFGGNAEKKKADRKKMMDDAKTQADEAARKADEINQAISTYLQRITAAAFAGQADTLGSRLAQFDIKAQQERLEAISKGGAAINLLEVALGLERANIVSEWGKKVADEEKAAADERARIAEAVAGRIKAAQDRVFNASIDTTTFAGKVAALERQFAQEQADEMKAGGEAINDLIAAQNAERLRLYQDAAEEQLRIQKEAFDDAKDFLTTASRSISQYIDGLNTDAQSPLSPAARLAAAQSQFTSQLGIIQGTDPSAAREALSGITGYAGSLLEAGRGYYGSTSAYQSLFGSVTGQLSALPSQVSPEQFIVNAIDSQTDTLSAYLASIDTNGDGLISRTESNGTFLASIFNELDTNGDGQLSKLELVRINTGNTTASVDAVQGLQASSNTINSVAQGLFASINSLIATEQSILTSSNTIQGTMSGSLSTQISQLSTANNSLATQINSLANLAKIVFNTATLVNFQNTTTHGSGAFARGGYVDGIGSDTSDSNRAWLSRGEFVNRASVVRAYGRGFFERLNSGAPIQLPSSGNDGMLLAELRNLRAEVAQLRAVVAVGYQYVGDRVDASGVSLADMAKATKHQSTRPRNS